MAAFTFGTAGERNKNIKQGRYGSRGGSGIKGAGGTFHKQLAKREITSTQLAAFQLVNELLSYTLITKDQRYQFKREFGEMDQLRYMNMRYLAAALVVLNDSKSSEPSAEMFTGPAWDLVSQQLSIVSGVETPELAIKRKGQLLIYIARINRFRETQKKLREAGIGGTNLDEPDPEELHDVVAETTASGLPLPDEDDE